MDRLLESVDQQASSAVAGATVEEQFDEGLFHQFMTKNPIWDFYSLTREQYVAKGRDDKLALMKKCYYDMKNDELLLFFVFFVWKILVAMSECLVKLG